VPAYFPAILFHKSLKLGFAMLLIRQMVSGIEKYLECRHYLSLFRSTQPTALHTKLTLIVRLETTPTFL
jgi:hypothetical protein